MTQPAIDSGDAVALPDPRERHLAYGVALFSAFLLGVNQALVVGVTTGTVVVVALLPVWLPSVPRFRFVRMLLILGVVALLWGVLVHLFQAARGFDPTLAIETAMILLTGLGGLGLLLWVRGLVGTVPMAIAFGAGALVGMANEVGGSTNLWKYQLSVPITIILLALVSRARSAVPTVVVLTLIATVSIATNSRGYFGFCLLAIVLVLWQRKPGAKDRRMNRLSMLALTAVAVAALYSFGTSLLVEGYLGEDAQQRTVQQIQESGSLLAGGRPEWAGTAELMAENPMGFGLGTLPSTDDVWVAKEGMYRVGVPTNNGYVDNYMFGGHIKLHSIVADLWASYGLVGLALGITLIVVLVMALLDRISARTGTGLVCFLSILGLWDLVFGPIHSNMPDLMIALAVVLPRMVAPAAGPIEEPEPEPDSPSERQRS